MPKKLKTIVVRDLDKLATQINDEHRQCETDLGSALGHAIKVGQLLAEAKAEVEHGHWLPWITENCTFTPRTAQGYMRIAQHQSELSNTQRVSHLPVRDALALLAEPKEPSTEPLADPKEPVIEFGDDPRASVFAAILREMGRIAPGTVISPTSLTLPHDISEEAYIQIGKLLQAMPGPADPDNPRPSSGVHVDPIVLGDIFKVSPTPLSESFTPPAADDETVVGHNGDDRVFILPSTHDGFFYVNHLTLDPVNGLGSVWGLQKPIQRECIACVLSLSECCQLPMTWAVLTVGKRHTYNVMLYVSHDDYVQQGILGRKRGAA